MNDQRIFFVGLGHLGSLTLDACLRVPGKRTFLVGGRHLDALRERASLALLSAIQLGYSPEVSCTKIDLEQVEHTAEVIRHFQPNVIINCATLQPPDLFHQLPPPLATQLSAAPLGPRLPLHLTPVYQLMQAIHLSGVHAIVLNGIYPDVTHPALSKVGLAPTTGFGDLANNVPALRKGVEAFLHVPLEQVDVRLVMARFVSYWLSRRSVMHLPYCFTALVGEKDVTPLLDVENLFAQLPTTWKRTGGTTGLLMTAASAATVFEGIVRDTNIITHAPGPAGLPGGYPIQVKAQGVEIVLPHGVTFKKALELNEAGVRLDGIESIEEDGTVVFSDSAMSIFKEILGYECQRMPLSETRLWAKEFLSKYAMIVKKYS